VSEWEIPLSRVVKYNGNNMVAYFCHHFQCEDEPGITKVMRDEGSVTLMFKLTLQSLQLQRMIMKPILELFPLHSAASKVINRFQDMRSFQRVLKAAHQLVQKVHTARPNCLF